jgi:hypothetical protein
VNISVRSQLKPVVERGKVANTFSAIYIYKEYTSMSHQVNEKNEYVTGEGDADIRS